MNCTGMGLSRLYLAVMAALNSSLGLSKPAMMVAGSPGASRMMTKFRPTTTSTCLLYTSKEYGGEKKPEADSVFTLHQKIVMVLFGLSFVVMIVGMVPWSSFGIHLFDHTGFLTRKNLGDWYFSELTAWFLLMGIVIGLVYGLKERDIVNSFLTGAGDLIGVALVIAVSRCV